jgi:hypothetical protein
MDEKSLGWVGLSRQTKPAQTERQSNDRDIRRFLLVDGSDGG